MRIDVHRWRQAEDFAANVGVLVGIVANARGKPFVDAAEFRADQVDIGDQLLERCDLRNRESGSDELSIRNRKAVVVPGKAQDDAADGCRDPRLGGVELAALELVQRVFVLYFRLPQFLLRNQPGSEQVPASFELRIGGFQRASRRLDTRVQACVLAGDFGDDLSGGDGCAFCQAVPVLVASDVHIAGNLDVQGDHFPGAQRSGRNDQLLDVAGLHGAHLDRDAELGRWGGRAGAAAAEGKGQSRPHESGPHD